MIIEPLEKYLKHNTELYENVRRIVSEGIIAGGAARQIFLGEQFGSTDVDFYFPTFGIFDAWSSNLCRQGYRVYSSTSKAQGYEIVSLNDIKLQLIATVFSDNSQEIFDTYDFTCCMFAIKDTQIYYTEEAAEHARKKQLVLQNKDNSRDLYNRVGKYLKKGYFPSCDTTFNVFADFIKYIDEYKIWDDKVSSRNFDDYYRKILPEELEEYMPNIFINFFGHLSGDY